MFLSEAHHLRSLLLVARSHASSSRTPHLLHKAGWTVLRVGDSLMPAVEGLPWHRASPWSSVPMPLGLTFLTAPRSLVSSPDPRCQQERAQVGNHKGGSPRQHIPEHCGQVAQWTEGPCQKSRRQAVRAVDGACPPHAAPPAFRPHTCRSPVCLAPAASKCSSLRNELAGLPVSSGVSAGS